MNEQLISQVVAELRAALSSRFAGKIFQLTPVSLAIDFGLKGQYLYANVEPASPRLFLIRRRLKDLEKVSIPLSPFGQLLRSKLGGAELESVEKDPDDRIVRFRFKQQNDVGEAEIWKLIVQLTGKAANVLLLNERDEITGTLRSPKGAGLSAGETYQPPPAAGKGDTNVQIPPGESPSDWADAYYQSVDAERRFNASAKSARERLKRALAQRIKLKQNLQRDLDEHGDAERHKRIGDLLLANATTAIRKGDSVELIDYYTDGASTVVIDIDSNVTLQEEASKRFRQYTKAKRAHEEVAERLKIVQAEIMALENKQRELEEIILAHDELSLVEFDKRPETVRTSKREPERIAGVRHYLSSDGYEILVGRAARDNDNLTFRVARPNDLWLHAGDYPGSHVVVRNPTRKEIPQRTIIEAAQLAGKFSQASEDSKVVVHYTQRKFLSKPKGVAPGLVRVSSFRSITVEPKETVERIR